MLQAIEQEEGQEPGQEQGVEQEVDTVGETTTNLHDVRLLLLDMLMQFIPELRNASGVLVIPFMQVIILT